MDTRPTPREWKAICFFVLMGLGFISAIGMIIELTFWSAGTFSAAFFVILALRAVYSAVSMFSDRTDPRQAKRPSDPP